VNKDNLPEIARQSLGKLLNESGGILYSSHNTLQRGDIYLLGYNPGGVGGHPIIDSVDGLLTNEENAYVDVPWENGIGSWEKGKAPLQERVKWLLKELGHGIEDVCASNLVFVQSKAATDVDFSFADKCWPVHEAILKLVKPKLLLVFGNSSPSPYSYLHHKFGGEQEYIPAGHGNWSAKGFRANINGSALFVAGLPHLSRYSPIGKTQVIDWLKSKLE